jgi:nitrate/nitrite-specific signal transduction histidine kinase
LLIKVRVGRQEERARLSPSVPAIRYERQYFRLLVTDDGRGIEPALLAVGGTEGHCGLRGMSARASVIGGRLSMWREADDGTEVELRVPARAAYLGSQRPLPLVT